MAATDEAPFLKLRPEPELSIFEVNGQPVPGRIWRGTTSNGTDVIAFVMGVFSKPDDDLAEEFPVLFEQVKPS